MTKDQAENRYYDLEEKLRQLSVQCGWTVEEMLYEHRSEIPKSTAGYINNVLKEQHEMIKIFRPEYANVIPFPVPGKRIKKRLWRLKRK